MFRRLLPSALFFILAAAPVRALDVKALEEHLRESYRFPADVAMTFSEPKPSEVEGFDQVEVNIERGERKSRERVHVSKSGRYYLLGGFRDLTVHPDQERIGKMDLASSPSRGKGKAPVQVVEYTDFQCPYCQKGYEIMRDKIMKEFPEDVRWVYKSLPLVQIHPWAEPAAVAAECAKKQGEGKFWKVHDAIFDKQREIRADKADGQFLEIAKAAGLDAKAFSACYDGKQTAKAVQKDVAEAEEIGVNGTPAFLVNGHLISGADYEEIKQVVREALAGKHGKP